MPTYLDIVNNSKILDSTLYTVTTNDLLQYNMSSVIDINNLNKSIYNNEILGRDKFNDYNFLFDYYTLIDHLMNFQEQLLFYDFGFGVSQEDLDYLICLFRLSCIREYFTCRYTGLNIFDAMFKFIIKGGQANTFRIINTGYIDV